MKVIISLLVSLVSIVVIAAIILLAFISYNNSFINQEESIAYKWAQVENQLVRQADLIPNLVSTVKGYAKHESTIFDNIAKARTAMLSTNSTISEKAQAQSELSTLLGRLLAISEAYPNLKANENFIALQSAIEGCQNRITVARMDYNNEVKIFNARVKGIPGRFMGYSVKEYFTPSDKTKLESVKVNF